MTCYYPGCTQRARTKEHIPPKSFFPVDQRKQLWTVRSCEIHNNEKSHDDLYVLAHICLNTATNDTVREIYMKRVIPQLEYNDARLKRMISSDAIVLPSGAVSYRVDMRRFDNFFSALSYGIVFKASGKVLPLYYTTYHIYHDFFKENETAYETVFKRTLSIYRQPAMEDFTFGSIKAANAPIYTAKPLGLPDFETSITIVHNFYGKFQVTSMLTNRLVHR